MKIPRKFFGLPMQKAISLSMAVYLVIYSAFPLILLQPAKAEEPSGTGPEITMTDNTVITETPTPTATVTPTTTPEVDEGMSLLAIDPSIPTPTNLGWNLSTASSTPNEIPLDLKCSDGVVNYTNVNSVSMNWSAVNGENIKYQREVTYPAGNVGYFYADINYTPFSTFGSLTGIEGLWQTRVRSFIDGNSNNVIDPEENTSEWSNNCQIRFDITAPSAPIITNPTLDYINTYPILNAWTIPSDDSGIDYYRVEYSYDDGHTFSDAPYRITDVNYRNHVPALTEQGGVQFRVQAYDNAGNVSEWSEWEHYFYDVTAPTTTVTGIDSLWHNTSVTLNFACVDLGGSECFETYYSIDGADFVMGNSVILTESGMHVVSYYSVDNAGNVENTITDPQTVNIDTIAPVIPTGLHFDNVARTETIDCGDFLSALVPVIPDWDDYDVLTDNSFSHYEYTSFLPNGSIGLNEKPLFTSELLNNWSPPADGSYGYAVRSVDIAGNKSDWALVSKTLEGSCQIKYDTVAPDVQLTSPTTNLLSGSVDIRGTVLDANPMRYYLVIQDSTGTTIAGPGVVYDSNSFTDKLFFTWDTSAFPDGTYTIKLEARDLAWNKDSGSFHWMTVSIDNTAPFLSLPDDFSVEATSLDGAIVTYEASAVDEAGGPVDLVCNPPSGSQFEMGDTTVECTARDQLGNSTSGNFMVTVEDTTYP